MSALYYRCQGRRGFEGASSEWEALEPDPRLASPRSLHGAVFDLINFQKYTGTVAFFSNPELNAVLGQADKIVLHALVNESSGTSPTLSIYCEDSPDAMNWANVSTVISAAGIGTTPILLRGEVNTALGRYVRFRIELGGTSPTAVMGVKATLRING